MKKDLVLIALALTLCAGLAHKANAFDVYSSSTPAVGTTSGVLCSSGTIAYLFSVCITSPAASNAAQTIVVGSTFSATAIPNTGKINLNNWGCITYQANYGTNGLSYTENGGQNNVTTYNYLCN